MTVNHSKWMKLAILEASRSLGSSGKNPPVGCVIVQNEVIIAKGRTSSSGRPHAEENAINNVKDQIQLVNSTMYVTLEPCVHKNNFSFSCAELIAKTSISKVFISSIDLDPRTCGRGIELLKKNNIEVIENFMICDSSFLYNGFFSRIINKKPYIKLKIACSLDGKIALNNNKSKWITNNLSRSYSHFMRSQNDAILTTSSTVLTDDPLLTCRLNGLEIRSPIKVLLDRYLKVSNDYKIFNNDFNQKLFIYYLSNLNKSLHNNDYKDISYIKININEENNLNYFNFIFNDLAEKGINNLLIECGSIMNTVLLSLNLVDELIIFRSGHIIGNDGLPFVKNLGFNHINELIDYKISSVSLLDDDILEVRKLNR